MTARKLLLYNIVSGFGVRAPHGHIKCKVNWKRTFKRLPN